MNKCFKCGSDLYERNGYVYCNSYPLTLDKCYYSWNTHHKNRIVPSLEELHRRVYES